MSWTQPACDSCWYARNPGRIPHRINTDMRETEKCCYCGVLTRGGIYVREDPAKVQYPT